MMISLLMDYCLITLGYTGEDSPLPLRISFVLSLRDDGPVTISLLPDHGLVVLGETGSTTLHHRGLMGRSLLFYS